MFEALAEKGLSKTSVLNAKLEFVREIIPNPDHMLW
jgi:hypothetical protein